MGCVQSDEAGAAGGGRALMRTETGKALALVAQPRPKSALYGAYGEGLAPAAFIARTRALDEMDFGEEGSYLRMQQTQPEVDTDEPKTEEEKKLQRYANILPSRRHRVWLQAKAERAGSSYVNASHVTFELDGSNGRYIAAMAPMEDGFRDFWELIWEQRVAVVVMLTKLEENGRPKASRYWPAALGETLKFGGLTVTSVGEDRREGAPDVIVRKLTMAHAGVTRHIRIVHYTGWGDQNVPADMESFTRFFSAWRHFRAQRPAPWLVHCSAGVGRTGTMLLIDVILDHVAKNGARSQINVFDTMTELRLQRPGSIQTPQQLKFVYNFCVYALERGLFGVKRVGPAAK